MHARTRLGHAASATAQSFAPKARAHAASRELRAVLRSPGERLDQPTRAFLNARLGRDFGGVRIHTDAAAARSAETMNARAYTLGTHIVFGTDYAPGTQSGKRLLAHELAHVAQSRGAALPGPVRLGSRHDAAERRADAFAAQLLAPGCADRASLLAHLSSTQSSEPVLRRTPKDACTDEKMRTWAGCFETEWYAATRDDVGTEARYGADIKIHFKPNDNVNAKQIAFVQTAQSSQDDQPVSIYFRDPESQDLSDPGVGPAIKGVARRDYGPKAKATALSRMIDPLDSGAGTAIDALPKSRTPLAGMANPQSGNDLGSSVETQYGHFGKHFREAGKPQHEDATMRDTPGLIVAKKSSASQTFESAVLAVSGEQAGAYYGSVRWGWTKGASEDKATLLPFRLAREAVPSAEFGEAAKLWNASKSTADEASIALPTTAEMFATDTKAALFDKPGKGKNLGKLDKNTRLEVTDQIDSAHKDWRRVIVASGALAGKLGWVDSAWLAARPASGK